MKRCLRIIVVALLSAMFLSTPIIVLASWAFSFPIAVTDTGGTARTYVPVVTGITGTNLVNSGYMTATGTDTNMQLGTTSVPFMLSTTNVTTVAPTLGAGSSTGLTLYTGYAPVQTLFSTIVGHNGFITTTDNAALEPGGTFTFETSGYVDTAAGATKTIVAKTNAFQTYVDPTTTGTVRSSIYIAPVSQTTTDSTIGIASVNPTRAGERFTNFPAALISSIDFKLGKAVAPTGNLSVTVRSVTGDTLLGTLGVLDVSTLNAVQTFKTFNTTPVQVPSIQDIRIQCEYTGGDGVNYVVVSTNSTDLYANAMQTTYTAPNYTDTAGADITWQNLTYTITATTTGVTSAAHVIKTYADATIMEMNVDNPTLVPNGSFEVSDPPYGWSHVGGTFSRSTTQVKLGNYSLKNISSGGISSGYIDLTSPGSYAGLAMTAGAWVWTATASQARIGVLDGASAYSSYHTGDSTWQWLSVTKTIGGAPAFVEIDLDVGAGATAYFDGAAFVQAATITPTTAAMIGTTSLSAVTVPDNANNWVWNQNDTMPYITYIKETVGATEVIKYQPTTMITGTALPNQDSGGSYPGVITWGANSNMTITFGQITSFQSTTANTGASSQIGYNVGPANMPSNWFGGGVITDKPFYGMFTDIYNQTGIPQRTMYSFIVFAVAIALGMGAFMMVKSMLIPWLIALIVLWTGVSASILPAWIVFVYIVGGLALIYGRRQL